MCLAGMSHRAIVNQDSATWLAGEVTFGLLEQLDPSIFG